VSCAATIRHCPARFSQVSVQTRQRFASLPLLSLLIVLSAPYAMAMDSPKNLTFTSPSWQSRARDFVSVVTASSLP
jgi:hypothetical protein